MHVSERARLGYVFIFLVAVDWILSSYLVQDLEKDRVPPFVITTVCNSLFLLCLFVHWGRRWIDSSSSLILRRAFGRPKRPSSSSSSVSVVIPPDVPESQLFGAAACVCAFWFLGQFTFDASLNSTDVTSNTILSSTSTIWTFILASALGLDNFTLTKLVCVLVTFGGVSFVTVAGRESATAGGHSGWGDFLAVASAVLYAAYTAIIKVALPSDERVSMVRMGFFGYLGLLNCIFSIPILLALIWAGALDTSGLSDRTIGLLVLKGLMDNVLSDYLWARAVLLTSPTVATCGTTIQVPISIVVDMLLGKAKWAGSRVPATLMLGGGTLVLIGFFGVVSETPDNVYDPGQSTDLVRDAAASLRRLRDRGFGRRRRMSRPGSGRFVTTLEDVAEGDEGEEGDEGGGREAGGKEGKEGYTGADSSLLHGAGASGGATCGRGDDRGWEKATSGGSGGIASRTNGGSNGGSNGASRGSRGRGGGSGAGFVMLSGGGGAGRAGEELPPEEEEADDGGGGIIDGGSSRRPSSSERVSLLAPSTTR